MRIRSAQLWLIFAAYESENGARPSGRIFHRFAGYTKALKNLAAFEGEVGFSLAMLNAMRTRAA
jgi:hypothetical protein